MLSRMGRIAAVTIPDYLKSAHGYNLANYLMDSRAGAAKKTVDKLKAFDWASRCRYECVLCDNASSFKTKQKFYHHMSTKHKETEKGYFERFGTDPNRTYDHKCHLCSDVFTLEPTSVLKHLKKHETTVVDYFLRYVTRNNQSLAASDPAEAADETLAILEIEYDNDEDEDMSDQTTQAKNQVWSLFFFFSLITLLDSVSSDQANIHLLAVSLFSVILVAQIA